MLHKVRTGAGVFFLLCSIFPLVGYGILNTGIVALCGLGIILLALPRINGFLAAFPLLHRLAVIGICGLLAFSAVISALMAYKAWFDRPPQSGEVTVIVLGGKVVGDQPTLMVRRRLDAAAEYLEQNPQARCIVSGGQGADEEYPEAVVMRNYLLRQGIDEDRIQAEAQSTNTRQNLNLSKALIENPEQPVVIVTDSFHQLRAGIFAKAEGLDPYHISSFTPWGLLPSYWAREILGVSWAWVTTHLIKIV